MHHETPAFRKHRPGTYVVKFESGMTEDVQADSQRDAMLKTAKLCESYGPFKKATFKASIREKKEKASYAKSQAALFQ